MQFFKKTRKTPISHVKLKGPLTDSFLSQQFSLEPCDKLYYFFIRAGFDLSLNAVNRVVLTLNEFLVTDAQKNVFKTGSFLFNPGAIAFFDCRHFDAS